MRWKQSFCTLLWLVVALWPALLSGCLSLAGANPFGLGTSWREEALLHDGRVIVVNRSVSYGGRHEIGQAVPIKEQTVSFSLPDSKKKMTWTSEYSEDIGRANLKPLAVHVLHDTPYIVATPNLCLAYNKWGRPNPPYIIFRYNHGQWNRITLDEFPSEFKEINVVINTVSHQGKLSSFNPASPQLIKQLNSSLRQPEYQAILREPIMNPDRLSGSQVMCEEMFFYKGAWVGPGDSIGKRLQDKKSKNNEINR